MLRDPKRQVISVADGGFCCTCKSGSLPQVSSWDDLARGPATELMAVLLCILLLYSTTNFGPWIDTADWVWQYFFIQQGILNSISSYIERSKSFKYQRFLSIPIKHRFNGKLVVLKQLNLELELRGNILECWRPSLAIAVPKHSCSLFS